MNTQPALSPAAAVAAAMPLPMLPRLDDRRDDPAPFADADWPPDAAAACAFEGAYAWRFAVDAAPASPRS